MMNTVLLSNKIGKVVSKHSKDAAQKVMTRYYERRKSKEET